jgi:MucR family transcriptional regulator, transcriptional regulator of exopolysaccharide biosynthesis
MIVENQRHTTDIVAAYVRHNSIATDQISGLINAVHSTLNGLGNEVVEEPPRVPAVSVRRSVRPGHIICIECGYKGQMLKKHLQSRHGLSVTQYKLRWKLASDHPMTAPNYSERRSQLAKSTGLGRKRGRQRLRPAAPSVTTSEKAPRRSVTKAVRTRKSDNKTRPAKANTSRARKASRTNGSRKTNVRKTVLRTTVNTASHRPKSRKSTIKARKGAPARRVATA